MGPMRVRELKPIVLNVVLVSKKSGRWLRRSLLVCLRIHICACAHFFIYIACLFFASALAFEVRTASLFADDGDNFRETNKRRKRRACSAEERFESVHWKRQRQAKPSLVPTVQTEHNATRRYYSTQLTNICIHLPTTCLQFCPLLQQPLSKAIQVIYHLSASLERVQTAR